MVSKIDFAGLRLLIIGKRGGILHWPEHLIAAARRMGITYEFFATNHQNSLDRIVRRGKSIVSAEYVSEHSAKQLNILIQRFRPNFVLAVDLVKFDIRLQEILIRYKHSYRSVHWIGDFFPKTFVSYNSFIDTFCFTDTYLLRQAEVQGLNNPVYLPLAVDTALFSRGAKPWSKRTSKILFVGAYSKNRYEILRDFDCHLKVYGKGWSKQLLPFHEVHPHNIPLKKVVELYGSHKVILNIINSDNIACGLNMRCFEATAAGALLLSDDVEDLHECFDSDKHLKLWEMGANGKIQFDENLMAAGEVARRGHMYTHKHHTYDNRLSSILTK